MLIIREEQMAVFSRAMREQFVDRAMDVIRTKFDARTQDFSDAALRSFIDIGIDKAKSYGIIYEKDVLCYLEHMFRLGVELDTDPELLRIHDILAKDIDGTMKILLINESFASQKMVTEKMVIR